MIPFHAFPQIDPGKNDEHAERDDLLNHFQLKRREFAIADAVRGNLKAILGEGNEPAYDDHRDQRRFAVFQVAVPCNRHEDIRTNQKKDRFHNTRTEESGFWNLAVHMAQELRWFGSNVGSANGNRTRISALKGPRANRCTIAPWERRVKTSS
jgi:hypothetical protein